MKAHDHQRAPDNCWAKAFKLTYKAERRDNRQKQGERKKEKNISS